MKHLEKKLKLQRLFNKNAQLPQTEKEFMDWFEDLASELSPENLSCDGELSKSGIKVRLKEIRACWSELETLYGKKVDVDSFDI